jgi:short-subunit dehydrogenase involved in D-alanine esterification of teichoic acids
MKNILLIGGSTGIGYELSQKLKEDNNLFIATRDKENLMTPISKQMILTSIMNLKLIGYQIILTDLSICQEQLT